MIFIRRLFPVCRISRTIPDTRKQIAVTGDIRLGRTSAGSFSFDVYNIVSGENSSPVENERIRHSPANVTISTSTWPGFFVAGFFKSNTAAPSIIKHKELSGFIRPGGRKKVCKEYKSKCQPASTKNATISNVIFKYPDHLLIFSLTAVSRGNGIIFPVF